MRLSRSLRTVVLSWHILASVGWFIAISMTLYMPIGPVLISGAAAVALITGCLLALGSPYGLTRYWWVLAKLGVSGAVLALGAMSLAGMLPVRATLGVRLGVLCALLAMVVLSVAKPRARTPWHDHSARHAR